MEIEPDSDSYDETNGRAVPIIQRADTKTIFSLRQKKWLFVWLWRVWSLEHNSEVKWMKWNEKDQKWPQESKSFQLSAPVVLCTQQCETHSAQNHQQTMEKKWASRPTDDKPTSSRDPVGKRDEWVLVEKDISLMKSHNQPPQPTNPSNTPPTWVRKLMAVSTSASNSGEHSHSIPDTCKYFFSPERNPLLLELVPAGDSWILWDLQPRNGEGGGESCHRDKLRYINDQIWEIQRIVVARTESKRCFVFFASWNIWKQVVEAVLLDVFVFVLYFLHLGKFENNL